MNKRVAVFNQLQNTTVSREEKLIDLTLYTMFRSAVLPKPLLPVIVCPRLELRSGNWGRECAR